MQIRQFEAPSIQEAMKKAKEALGPDAIILSSKRNEDGGSPLFVVTAAVDENGHNRIEPLTGKAPLTGLDVSDDIPRGIARPRLQDTLTLLKRMIEDSLESRDERDDPGERALDTLLAIGVEREMAYLIAGKLLASFNGCREDLSTDKIRAVLEGILKVTGEIAPVGVATRFIIFLGPPGVGKTTTLAKIAARLKRRLGRPVALMSTDVYRIGAMDQLRIYGDLMGLPVEKVATKAAFRKVCATYSPETLFLVDTTGRSHLDDTGLVENKILLDPMMEKSHTFLLLDTGRKSEDLLDEIRGFSLFPVDSLIWTKVDTTGLPGEMINIMLREKIPISYITTGQNVPEDIELARSGRLAEIILKDTLLRRDLWTRRQDYDHRVMT